MMNTSWKAGAAVGALLLLALLNCGGGEATSTIVVDSTADTDSRDGVVTLREAMLLASGELAAADLDPAESDNVGGRAGSKSSVTIVFDPSAFPAPGGGTISLVASLPALGTGSDTIDGSERGVIIDGINKSFECITIASNDNALKGLQIENCLKAVMIQPGARRNEIGSSSPGEGNIVSANDEGIVMGGEGADGNMVKGNLIGVDASGGAALSNRNGLYIYAGARENIIGGSNPGDRNIISGNEGVGITIGGSANIVQGNYIGTDKNGTAAIPNAMEGIWLAPGAQDNVIGGSKATERNVISGNDLFGISILGSGTTGNLVKGNYIGVDASGQVALPNRHSLDITDGPQDNVIGGSAPGEGNVISAKVTGVLIRGTETTGNVIIGNHIGIDVSRSQPTPNAYGIWISLGAHHNTIGGTRPREGNVIASNSVFGVQIEGQDTLGNTIRGNSIYANAGGGIQNADGGNAELEPPAITGATLLDGSACSGCTVDIYSDSGDQGEVYEGSAVADADGSFSFKGRLSGPNVTATATDSNGNTSAFSRPLLEVVRQ